MNETWVSFWLAVAVCLIFFFWGMLDDEL